MANIISGTHGLGALPAEAWGTIVASIAGMTTLLIIVIAWCLVWKGLALWRAARSGAKVWFIVLLLINTLGLLDILYYFYIHQRKWGKK